MSTPPTPEVSPDTKPYGVEFMAKFVLKGADAFGLVKRILSPKDPNDTPVTHYFDEVHKLARMRYPDVAKPELNGALPEQRLFVTLFGFNDSKSVNNLISKEIELRVKGMIGHFEKTVQPCKLEFGATEFGFTIKNHGDALDGTYCFVEVQIKFGLIFVISPEIMAEHLIDRSRTTRQAIVLSVPDLDGLDPTLEFVCQRKLTSRGIQYFVAPVAEFPSNDTLNRAVTLITSVFEPKIRMLQQMQRAARRARLPPGRCVAATGHSPANRRDADHDAE